jgi:hypothetical protein
VTQTAGPTGRRRWWVFIAAWVALGLLAGAWAVSSPLSTAPDEPAHFVKAASVVRGQLVGPQGTYGNDVQVPNYVSWTIGHTCFKFHDETPANCIPPLVGDPWETVTAPTTAGYYNPVYYAVVGWPTLILQSGSGLYAMRFVSAVVTTGLLALSFMLVFTWKRRALPLIGLVAAVTPMVIYVAGVVNPSAFEIAGTLTTFVAITTIITQPNKALLRERSIVLVVAAVLALNMRTISPLWILLAIALPFLLLPGRELLSLLRQRTVIVSAAVIAAAAAVALAWTPLSSWLGARANEGAPAPTLITTVFPDVGESPLYGFAKTLGLTFTNTTAMIGNFGWLDTPAPAVTVVIWTVLVGAILLAGASLLGGRRAVVASLLFLLALLCPALIQAAFITDGGYIWQGRYGLPIFVMMIFGIAALVSVETERAGARVGSAGRALGIVLALWAVGQACAFVIALRRNVVGTDAPLPQLFSAPAWLPPGGTTLSLVMFAVGLVAVAAVSASFVASPRGARGRA